MEKENTVNIKAVIVILAISIICFIALIVIAIMNKDTKSTHKNAKTEETTKTSETTKKTTSVPIKNNNNYAVVIYPTINARKNECINLNDYIQENEFEVEIDFQGIRVKVIEERYDYLDGTYKLYLNDKLVDMDKSKITNVCNVGTKVMVESAWEPPTRVKIFNLDGTVNPYTDRSTSIVSEHLLYDNNKIYLSKGIRVGESLKIELYKFNDTNNISKLKLEERTVTKEDLNRYSTLTDDKQIEFLKNNYTISEKYMKLYTYVIGEYFY